jgi:dihydroorotase
VSTLNLLLTDVRVLNPEQGLDQVSDVWISEGKLKAIEPAAHPVLRSLAERPIQRSGAGLWLLPGLIDAHVHLREPGFEAKETLATGTQAALAGGFTTVACMANTQPVNDCPAVTEWILEKARTHGQCRVLPIGAVTRGLKGQELADLKGLVQAGVCALSDDGMPVMNSQLMRQAMEQAHALGRPIISHAEDACLQNGSILNEGIASQAWSWPGNPAAGEEILVAREIALCRLTGCSVHIAHISTAVALEHLRRARHEGLPVTAEACPHHLFLTEEDLFRTQGLNTSYKMAPPLRTTRDQEALRKALAEGLVSLIATDHAPHTATDKALPFAQAANGIIGLQTAVPLTLQLVQDGLLSAQRWAESLTLAPARLLGRSDLGRLTLGALADLTVIDPHTPWTFTRENNRSKSENSPFLGTAFPGKVAATFYQGRLAEGQLPPAIHPDQPSQPPSDPYHP